MRSTKQTLLEIEKRANREIAIFKLKNLVSEWQSISSQLREEQTCINCWNDAEEIHHPLDLKD